jgi:hypothetical protein
MSTSLRNLASYEQRGNGCWTQLIVFHGREGQSRDSCVNGVRMSRVRFPGSDSEPLYMGLGTCPFEMALENDG